MTPLSVGDVTLIARPGRVAPSLVACDARLSTYAISSLSTDFCGVTSLAGLSGIGVTTDCDAPGWFGTLLNDPTAWNSINLFRVASGDGVEIPMPLTIRKQWVRIRARFNATFGVSTYLFALRDDPSARAGPYLGLYSDHSEIDFTGWSTATAVHSGSLNATLNDGATWWDIVFARLQGAGATGFYTGRVYIAPSAGGAAVADITDGSQNYDDTQGGSCGGNSLLKISGPDGGYFDLGSIETADGDVNANPYSLP